MLTLTGRAGPYVDYDSPQPEIWAVRDPEIPDRHDFPRLPRDNPMKLQGRHVRPGPAIIINGDRVRGEVSCRSGGRLPDCVNNDLEVRVDSWPDEPGMHLIQLQNAGGLQSNDFIFFLE